VRGRLASQTHAGTNYQFFYDPSNLRVKKIAGATTTTYLLDGGNVVKETTGGVATDLLQGPGLDHPLKRGSQWYNPDAHNSTADLTDASGNLLQRYNYHPFGQVSAEPLSGDPQPIRFTGPEDDGTRLMDCQSLTRSGRGGRRTGRRSGHRARRGCGRRGRRGRG
jgi:hypothetical protein